MKKNLITGGASFIGTNLVQKLKSRRYEVLASDLVNTERDSYIRADVRNYRQVERIFEKHTFDYLRHLAGIRLLFAISTFISNFLTRIIYIKITKRIIDE